MAAAGAVPPPFPRHRPRLFPPSWYSGVYSVVCLPFRTPFAPLSAFVALPYVAVAAGTALCPGTAVTLSSAPAPPFPRTCCSPASIGLVYPDPLHSPPLFGLSPAVAAPPPIPPPLLPPPGFRAVAGAPRPQLPPLPPAPILGCIPSLLRRHWCWWPPPFCHLPGGPLHVRLASPVRHRPLPRMGGPVGVPGDSLDDGATFGELLGISRAHRGGRRGGWGGKSGGLTDGRYRLLPVSFWWLLSLCGTLAVNSSLLCPS